MQKPRTIRMLFFDYLFLVLISYKIGKCIYYNKGKFLIISFFETVWPKIENIKMYNFWRLTAVQVELFNPSKLDHICSQHVKVLSWWRTKSSTYKQAPNFVDGQQFHNCFVFNRILKSRWTKYIAYYFENLSCNE